MTREAKKAVHVYNISRSIKYTLIFLDDIEALILEGCGQDMEGWRGLRDGGVGREGGGEAGAGGEGDAGG